MISVIMSKSKCILAWFCIPFVYENFQFFCVMKSVMWYPKAVSIVQFHRLLCCCFLCLVPNRHSSTACRSIYMDTEIRGLLLVCLGTWDVTVHAKMKKKKETWKDDMQYIYNVNLCFDFYFKKKLCIVDHHACIIEKLIGYNLCAKLCLVKLHYFV